MLIMFTFVILILLALGILSIPSTSGGDSPKANDLSSIVHSTVVSDGDEGRAEQWVEVISWEPRAFVFHNFLTKEECDYLISLAKPHMQKSTVVDSETGKSKDSRVRTSSGTFLARGRDKIIRNIEKKIADFTFLPAGMWFKNPMFLYVLLIKMEVSVSSFFESNFCFIFIFL
jgi:prolyl 4-hydroxylase